MGKARRRPKTRPSPPEAPKEAFFFELFEWLASPGARDLNEDGVIDYVDYLIYLGIWKAGEWGPAAPFQALEDWIASPDARDLNEDGVIDYVDYLIYLGIDARDLNEDGVIDYVDYLILERLLLEKPKAAITPPKVTKKISSCNLLEAVAYLSVCPRFWAGRR